MKPSNLNNNLWSLKTKQEYHENLYEANAWNFSNKFVY